jgi:hypothetical protein
MDLITLMDKTMDILWGGASEGKCPSNIFVPKDTFFLATKFKRGK